VLVTASTIGQFAEGAGLAAAAIAVCGFLAHAPQALRGGEESALRQATVAGGLFGFVLAALVVVLSVSGVI